MAKKLDWKEIKSQPLAENYEEKAYKNLGEARSIKEPKKWSLGKEGKKGFDKYQEYVTPVNKHTDTNKFIESMKFNGKSAKLQEGYGAGYNIHFYGLKLQNVKIDEEFKDEYGTQNAYFTADIVPNGYDWSADHPMWSLDSRKTNYYDDFEFDVESVLVSGSVKGSWSNGVQAWKDADAEDFDEEGIRADIQNETYDLGYSYSWGWVHTDVKKNWHIPDEKHPEDTIDESDDRSGYKNCYIESADLILDDRVMNGYIDQAENPEDYFDGGYEEDEEEYLSNDDEYSFDKGTELSRLHRESKRNTSKRVRESIRGNTKQFIQNVVDYLNDYMPDDEDWLNMEENILNLTKYSKYRNFGGSAALNDAIRTCVEGGYLDVYYNQVNDSLNRLYMNTPEEAKKWEKYPNDKKWDKYVNVMVMYIPKAFKIRMGRPLGQDVPVRPVRESKMKEKNSGTVEVLLYFDPKDRDKALSCLSGKMDVYKFDDYYSYDFKGAVTKGALDKGVVVYGSYTGKIADEAKDIVDYVKEICPYPLVDYTYVRAMDESKMKESSSRFDFNRFRDILLSNGLKVSNNKKDGRCYFKDPNYMNFMGCITYYRDNDDHNYLNILYPVKDREEIPLSKFVNTEDICNYILNKKLSESNLKERFWKDPGSEQARAEQSWWKNHVKVIRDNVWEDPDCFSFEDNDAKAQLKRFGKIYMDTNTYKPIDPNYVQSLIDEWGDK